VTIPIEALEKIIEKLGRIIVLVEDE